ncbi:MAG: LuxR family transcriptional regulator, partial [Caldilinea sp. CFX5]|nr:LuxR family transcriptional regulator [Caldilinea sp. CFX5]
NDPTRFLTYLIAALRTCHPALGVHAAALLATPQAPPMKTILTILLNELESLTTPFALVLDDYHVITTPAIQEGIAFFIDHLPRQIHIILTSRADPPLPLARWRGRNQLMEVRTEALRFTPAEATIFLNDVMGLHLNEGDVAALEARTEGWITGLQLAALSMQGRDDYANFVKAFTGSHRFVLTYLTEEVLQQQPAALQTFLLQTSILERLSADLCDAVTERSDSQSMLETLEQANLFIAALDHAGVWYRYHTLFADLLRHRLQRQAPDQLPGLHRRAATWHRQQNQPGEAIKHALAIPDFDLAADWIEQMAHSAWMRGEMGLLLGWLKALPPAIVQARPRLALAYAWVLTYTGPLAAVEGYVQAAEAALAHHPQESSLRGEIAAIYATVASFQGATTRTIALCHQALLLIAPENTYLRAMTMQALGFAYRINGQVLEANKAFTEALALSRASNQLFWQIDALCNLGIVQVMQGQLRTAAQTIQSALALVEAQGGEALPIASEVYFTWASLLHEWHDLTNAQHYLQKSLELGERSGNTDILLSSYSLQAKLKHTQRQSAAALAALQQAQQLARHYQVGRLIERLDAYQAQLWVAYGDLAAAEQWAAARQRNQGAPADFPQAIEEMTLARLRLAQGEPAVALRLLEPLMADAQAAGRISGLIQLLALTALIQKAQGQVAAAMTTLAEALRLAAPEGYVSTFVDEGEAMYALLLAFRTSHHLRAAQANPANRLAYVDKLLAAFPRAKATMSPTADAPPLVEKPQATRPALIEPLSERELEVLALIAAGRANREIGTELVIEVGTVKRHVTNIFGKLGVTSRTQAVATARQLGLL